MSDASLVNMVTRLRRYPSQYVVHPVEVSITPKSSWSGSIPSSRRNPQLHLSMHTSACKDYIVCDRVRHHRQSRETPHITAHARKFRVFGETVEYKMEDESREKEAR